ncbi:MAG TPA: hypothetical protein VII13_16305 [Vicinamibacteria bacterium]|jgi:hypothetical protein
MATGELALRATIWAALLAWTAREALAPGARWLWTAGALGNLAHALLAFHLRHAWSHAAAVADTARQTEALLGSAVGAGIYVNYAFAAWWTLEAAWWWRDAPAFRRRPRPLVVFSRAFFVFMWVNGAIVFARGPIRLLGVACVLAVSVAWYRRAGGAEQTA